MWIPTDFCEDARMARNEGIGFWLTRRAELTPSRTALVFEGRQWTYREFNQQVDRCATALTDLGVCHGDRVAVLTINVPQFLEVLFACGKLGARFVPLNFRLAGPELSFIVNDAGVHTIVVGPEFIELVDSVRPELCVRHYLALQAAEGGAWLDYDDVVSRAAAAPSDNEVKPDEVAIIMYTSGTTGRPKGAMLTHGNLLWNNINAALSFDTLEDDVTLVCAPLFHIGGLNVTTLITLLKGGTVVLLRAFDPAKVLDLIEEHRVNSMFGVPAMFLFMSQLPGFGDRDLSSVRSFICGGAPVPEPLIRLYQDRGIPFVQGYGLTETAPFATLLPKQDSLRKVGSAGLAPMFTEVRVVDDRMDDVKTGEIGEVVIKGPNVMKGYWNRPDATAQAITHGGWFHSGDLGVLDEDGYLYLKDRMKDMIISGGENIYPAELESVLIDHPAVADVAVIGMPDEKWGEAVVAVVVKTEGVELSPQDVIDFANGRLARYKLPRQVVFTDLLPRNPAGKVLKRELREQFGSS
jgi:fatty-acyl-CoA synthase